MMLCANPLAKQDKDKTGRHEHGQVTENSDRNTDYARGDFSHCKQQPSGKTLSKSRGGIDTKK
jgi:hypothetical protein